MLRAMVLLLLVANGGFHAWTRGWLDGVVGVSPHAGREPERLSRQVRPELVRILPPGSLLEVSKPAEPQPAPAPAAASIAPVAALVEGDRVACLQAGPFSPDEVAAAEAQVQNAVPALEGGLANLKVETPGVWLIYMGRFASRDALHGRLDELRRFPRLAFDEVRDLPQLEPGIVLGRHESRAAAESALDKLAERGVRNARVLALTAPQVAHTLRVARADNDVKSQLSGLAVGPSGAPFLPCPVTTTAQR